MATGQWDPARPGTPGRGRFLASDADRERAIDALKTAFVQGVLTRDELGARTGRALTARTYAQLAAITAGLSARSAEAARQSSKPARTAPARKLVTKKVIAWGACAIILPPALGATFLSYYGGFLVMFLFTFIGTVLLSMPSAPTRMSGRR